MSSKKSYEEWKAARARNPVLARADRIEQLRAKLALFYSDEQKKAWQAELDELMSASRK